MRLGSGLPTPEPSEPRDMKRSSRAAVALLAGISILAGWLTGSFVSASGPQAEWQVATSVSVVESGALYAAGDTPSVPVPRDGVLAIGDGVLWKARSCLADRGIDVYPEPVGDVSALLPVLHELVAPYAAVLLHVGHRSGLVDGDVERALGEIGGDHRVIWGTISIPDVGEDTFSFEDRTNVSIRTVVARHPEARLLDWHDAALNHPEWIEDGWRPSEIGCVEYARKVAKVAGLPWRT